MKRTIIIILAAIVLVLSIGLMVSYNKFNHYKAGDAAFEINPSDLVYFQDTYDQCRDEFLCRANDIKNQFANVQISKIMVESKVDTDLTLDYCYIPAQKEKKRLLILSSGTHGVEGFVGSAIQQMVMAEILNEEVMDDMGVLFLHAMNPYGFKYLRRVTENNVDLNRNCEIGSTLYTSKNSGYTRLYDMINPKGEVNLKSIGNKFFYITAIKKIISASMATLRQAILQGQYEYNEGLYFGGKKLEPQIESVSPLLINVGKEYEIIFNIDLHTGYGERGTLHLFPNPIDDKKKRSDLETIFTGYHIDWGDGEDFYTITGDLSNYMGKIQPDKYFLPMVFEFGTLNSQATMGAIKSLHNMIVENQGVQFGYKTKNDEERTVKNVVEMYYPSSELWRGKVLSNAREILLKAIGKYKQI